MMLEAALIQRLGTLAANLYPLLAPKNYATPAVIYQRVLTKPVTDLSQTVEDAWVYEQVKVCDPDYEAAITLAKQIRDNLTHWQDADVQCVVWDNEEHYVDDTTDVALYSVAMRFIILAAV